MFLPPLYAKFLIYHCEHQLFLIVGKFQKFAQFLKMVILMISQTIDQYL